MKCNDVLLLLSEYSRAELAALLQLQVQSHLNQCQTCTQQEKLHRQLSQLLQQNPPMLPQSLTFSMMPDRLWEELAAKRKKRVAWFGFLGFAASLAVVALVFLWPGTPKESSPRQHTLPGFSVDELYIAEEALSQEDSSLASLFEPIDLSELDEEASEVLSQKLSQSLPEKEEADDPLEGDEGDYLDDLDSLSPEELDRLEKLLETQKKG